MWAFLAFRQSFGFFESFPFLKFFWIFRFLHISLSVHVLRYTTGDLCVVSNSAVDENMFLTYLTPTVVEYGIFFTFCNNTVTRCL
jgi:hypothetical protein